MDCWIGCKVTILVGVHIGENTNIPCCAVVKEDLYKVFSVYGCAPEYKIESLK